MSTPNLTLQLFSMLWSKTQISGKARERLTSEESFLHLKDQLENKCIFNGDLFELFEKASIDEIKELSLDCDVKPNFFNCYTLYFVLNDTLKRLIDDGQELTEKAQIILSKYREIQQLYPALADEKDEFTLYLANREKRQLIERYKETGEGCPYCLSTEHIQHYGENKMKCTSCNHYWRT